MLRKYYVIVCLFFISSCLANGKHRTENHTTKVKKKTQNEVTKICNEPGISFTFEYKIGRLKQVSNTIQT